MKFSISSDLSYQVFSPATFILNIQAASTAQQTIIDENLSVTPSMLLQEFMLDNSDSRYIKLEVPEGTYFTISYQATVEVEHRVLEEWEFVEAIPIMQLDKEVLPYLFPSRHCQSDQLRKFAQKKFGKLQTQFATVRAISNWIYNNIDYITGTTDSGTSAYDTLVQREGVCKDFAHLGIALCRALDIPARYFTAYAYKLNPPDFHACFEAYIGGHWLLFDPTGLVPVNGLVKIAHSVDATQAAVASFFGQVNCTYMNVHCSAEAEFTDLSIADDTNRALSYE